jgi:tetratricopeptide (TPR) repeat protein
MRIFLAEKSKLIYCLCGLAFVITGLVEAIWGLRQLYGFTPSQHGLFKITGSFFNPGPYSGWLAMVFPMAFCSVTFRLMKNMNWGKIDFRNIFSFLQNVLPEWVKTMTGFLTVLSILLVLPAAMSRASWLAALGGCVFTGILYGLQNKGLTNCCKMYGKRMIVISFAAAILFAILMTGLFFLKKDSASGRAFTWKIAAKTIVEHPLGVGLGNFAENYGDLQAEYFASGAGSEREEYIAGGVEYAFNEYLQICIETGIVPFMIFLAFVGYVLWFGIKNKNYLPFGSLVSLLIFALMSYPFNILPFVIAFAFLSALCMADINNNDNDEKSKKTYPKFMIWTFLLAVPVFIYGHFQLSTFNFQFYKAYKQWNSAVILCNMNINKEAIDEYAKQYPYLQDEIRFLFEYAQCLSKSKQYLKSNEILHQAIHISCDPMLYNIMGKNHQALKQYELAERSFRKASNIVPNRLYPHYMLAKLYYEMGLKDKMESEINIVLTKLPKVESIAVEEMREELRVLRTNAK